MTTTTPQVAPSRAQRSQPAHVPLRERLNLRLIAFVVALLALFGAIGYTVLEPIISGGIRYEGDLAVVDLKPLGYFVFDQQTGTIDNVPQRFRELDGKRVKLKGFMFSPTSAGGRGREFQFVYNVEKCCFNGPPQVQERVYGYAAQGVPLFDQYQFAEIVGVLHVRVVRDAESGAIKSVYDMDVESATAVRG